MCLQCEQCWEGSGKLRGHKGRHSLNPVEYRKRKRIYKQQSSLKSVCNLGSEIKNLLFFVVNERIIY